MRSKHLPQFAPKILAGIASCLLCSLPALLHAQGTENALQAMFQALLGALLLSLIVLGIGITYLVKRTRGWRYASITAGIVLLILLRASSDFSSEQIVSIALAISGLFALLIGIAVKPRAPQA
jgi:uncharacterized membrane protein YhaH (DUF805 family)